MTIVKMRLDMACLSWRVTCVLLASQRDVLQAALVEMNDSALTIDQLDALSRAVPDDQERKDIRLYLQVTCSHAADITHCTCCSMYTCHLIQAVALVNTPAMAARPCCSFILSCTVSA